MEEFSPDFEEKDLKYYIQKYKINILIGIIVFLFLVIIIILVLTSNQKVEAKNTKEITLSKETKKKVKVEKPKTIKVDIKGSIINPGVYELEEKSRVIDVITRAGGLMKNADTSYINLSKKINDEMVIIIYSKDEVEQYKKDKKKIKYIEIEADCECPDEMNDACITKKETNNTKSNTKTNTTKEKEDTIISINEATLEELQTLTGIGKSKAESIIEYREKNGNFKDVEDIKNVSGIGDSVFEKIKDQIKL